jgi:hypothetical protein
MARFSNVRLRASWTSAAIGSLPIPDPRTWPAGARERFREMTGECGPLDVFIFTSGPVASFYLHDAVTAAGILEVDPSGWHTEDGYPALHFPSSEVEEYSRRLTACGYAVRVIEMAGGGAENGVKAAPAPVIDIASARRGEGPRESRLRKLCH